ncbi:sperm acrosome-associated protein 9 [Pangasianodon hypophthalmus]|uniref:sperm acrosome-associated protein 9 n=1 Tax=Pangasianodon hypophthalmus TaxID=310915 RepID=UPI000F005452|nr:sperm acrosome-associated protein 9 [Pangasianodon hypophthalmus]
MNEVREMMLLVEKKHQLFKQQQFTFIAALERSREHARHRTQAVSTVTQVQCYMTDHCSNATDMRIFSLFLDIMDSLKEMFQMIESLASAQNHSSEVLDTCRNVLSPDCNFSQFQAHYPHDEVNRLSCNEARNYYGGVVSVIPLTLDLLRMAISELAKASTKKVSRRDITAPEKRTAADNVEKSVNATEKTHASMRSSKPACKGANGCKPAWRPPGRRRM